MNCMKKSCSWRAIVTEILQEFLVFFHLFFGERK
jgi:hypothetical protein